MENGKNMACNIIFGGRGVREGQVEVGVALLHAVVLYDIAKNGSSAYQEWELCLSRMGVCLSRMGALPTKQRK